MISGGVSFDGDPAKARAALVEALHCAHIVRATKSRLGLRELTKQFDLAGGGVVWITDNEFVHHIYIDVRDEPVRPVTTEESPVEQGYYSINPAVLFASADFPNGVKPAVPASGSAPAEPAVAANYDATPSGSLWKNPPFANGKDLKFKHGKYKLSDATDPGNAFPGILDWSDRRPPGEAEHYGIVLSWWPAPYDRGVRYAIPAYYYADWEDPSPTLLQDLYYGQPFLDELGESTLGLIWANGVPVVQTGMDRIYAAFLKTETVSAGKKTFLWVATDDWDNLYLRKYEFPAVIKKGMPVLGPADFVDSSLVPRPTAPVGELPANSSYNGYSRFESYFMTANSSGTKLLTVLTEYYNGGPYPFPVYNNSPWVFSVLKIVEVDVASGGMACVKKLPDPNPPQSDVGNVTVTYKNQSYDYSAAYWQYYPRPPWWNTGETPPYPYSYIDEEWKIYQPSGYYNRDVDVDVPAFSYDRTFYKIFAIDYVGDTPTYVYGLEKRVENRSIVKRFITRSTSGTSGGGYKTYVVSNYYSGYYRYDDLVQEYTTDNTSTWTETQTDGGPVELSFFLGLGATETLLHQESKGSTRTTQITGSWVYSRSYSSTTNGANIPSLGLSSTSSVNNSTNIQYDINYSTSGVSAYPEVFLIASDLRVGLVMFDIHWDVTNSDGSSSTDSRTYTESGTSSYTNDVGSFTNNRTYTTSYAGSGGNYSGVMSRVSTHSSFAISERLIEQYDFPTYSETNTITDQSIPDGAYSFMNYPSFRQYPAGYSGYYWPPYITVYFPSSYTTTFNYAPESPPDYSEVARGVLFSQDNYTLFPDCFAASGATSSFDNKLIFAWAVTRIPYDPGQNAYDLTPDNTVLVSKLFLASNPSISVDLTNPDFHPDGFTGPGLTEKLRGAVQFLLLGPVADDEGALLTKPTTLSSS